MARKRSKNPRTLSTTDGGTITIAPSPGGKGFLLEITRGFKETPEERQERLRAGNRARTFTSAKQKQRGGRQGAKRDAIRDSQ